MIFNFNFFFFYLPVISQTFLYRSEYHFHPLPPLLPLFSFHSSSFSYQAFRFKYFFYFNFFVNFTLILTNLTYERKSQSVGSQLFLFFFCRISPRLTFSFLSFLPPPPPLPPSPLCLSLFHSCRIFRKEKLIKFIRKVFFEWFTLSSILFFVWN